MSVTLPAIKVGILTYCYRRLAYVATHDAGPLATVKCRLAILMNRHLAADEVASDLWYKAAVLRSDYTYGIFDHATYTHSGH